MGVVEAHLEEEYNEEILFKSRNYDGNYNLTFL